VEQNLCLIKESLESLHLNLKGFEDWDSLLYSQSSIERMARTQAAGIIDDRLWEDTQAIAALTTWTNTLNNDLVQLATTAKDSRKLRELRIVSLSECHPSLQYRPDRDYLSVNTMQALLSLENLTVLELDLCGTQLRPEKHSVNSFHICPIIGALLANLKRLRLRMRHICSDALRPPDHGSCLRLTEMIVNLSLYQKGALYPSYSYASRCDASGRSIIQLHAEIQHEANLLAKRMASPEMVRVLSHKYPPISISISMTSLDVLAGRRMRLNDDAAWDDDGVPIEDDTESEESEESDIEDSISTASDEL